MKKVIVLIIILSLSSCATGGFLTRPEKEYQAACVFVKEKKYKEAVAAYKKISADDHGSSLAADSLFQLAIVHAHHDNPERNYALAIQTFEEFVKQYPDNNKTEEAQTWISVLKTVQELKKQNEHLNTSIEELKKLDIRHEEKRKKK